MLHQRRTPRCRIPAHPPNTIAATAEVSARLKACPIAARPRVSTASWHRLTRQYTRASLAVNRDLPVYQNIRNTRRKLARIIVSGVVVDAFGIEDHYVRICTPSSMRPRPVRPNRCAALSVIRCTICFKCEHAEAAPQPPQKSREAAIRSRMRHAANVYRVAAHHVVRPRKQAQRSRLLTCCHTFTLSGGAPRYPTCSSSSSSSHITSLFHRLAAVCPRYPAQLIPSRWLFLGK